MKGIATKRRWRAKERPAPEPPARPQSPAELQPTRKRSFHDGAHKIESWSPAEQADRAAASEAVRRRFEALDGSDHDVVAQAGRAVLVLGALGVVYGDIGTSPLYTEQAIFTSYHATRTSMRSTCSAPSR